MLDLTISSIYPGTNITISAKRGDAGDGLANVGRIKATGIDLGVVTLIGDLGRIDAGDDSALAKSGRDLVSIVEKIEASTTMWRFFLTTITALAQL